MNKVVLIGTLHPIQRDKSNVEFSAFISKTIDKYKISTAAEEINIPDSVISDLCNSLNLDYQNIEPNEEERAELGIKSIGNIKHDIFYKYDDDKSPEALTDPLIISPVQRCA
ncbi:hypothetical protein [Motilimonas pumila]|uniref:Uncharacterized protein n=1 Tax=Motilimonas pumila TaxID=2303987 RepID=A0A418Y980_9GAMM|nr:hypothetical protein [Motilimonas pumila]RJG36723.1 hypothetical protein D1Z90_20260 [Motilimonas pumila]